MMRRFLLDPTGGLSGDAGSLAASPLTSPIPGTVLGSWLHARTRSDAACGCGH
jgi:hypothetical protein